VSAWLLRHAAASVSEKVQRIFHREKIVVGAEENEGLLAQAKDNATDSGYFNCWKACLFP